MQNRKHAVLVFGQNAAHLFTPSCDLTAVSAVYNAVFCACVDGL